MKAEELRIGNYIQRLDGSVFKVTIHDMSTIYLWTANERLLPTGIELNDGWLLKFGFECWFDGALKKLYVLHNAIDGTSDFEVTIEGNKAFASIDENCCCWSKKLYVHTLQNLYFALTGNELTA